MRSVNASFFDGPDSDDDDEGSVHINFPAYAPNWDDTSSSEDEDFF